MMARKLSCLLFLISLVTETSAQSWEFLRSYNLEQPITTVDVGTLGKIYLGTSRGNVYSFQADGTPDTQFSSAVFQPVTCIDAANQLKVFAYYSSVGKFEFLDRFSAMERTYHIADFGVSAAQLAMPSINNFIWFLSGNELIQVNPLDRMVLSRIVLSGVSLAKPNQLRIIPEGFAVSDEQGLHLFRRSGEWIYSVEARGIQGFTVEEGMAVVQTAAGMMQVNLQSSKVEWTKAPRSQAQFAFRSGEFYHFVEGSQLFTYHRTE